MVPQLVVRPAVSAPVRGATTATISWPQRSLGRLVTMASATVGMGDEGLLHLLGEDLLAPGVDRHRVASQQLDRTVGQQPHPIARHRVADTVDHREGGGRLGGVAQVSQGHAPGLGEPPDLVVAGRQAPAAVLRQHHGMGAAAGSVALGTSHGLTTGLRRPEDVDDAQRRDPLDQSGLDGGGQHGAARQQEAQVREVVWASVHLVQQRPGERVAHYLQRGHPLALAGGQHVGRVEPGGLIRHDHRAAARRTPRWRSSGRPRA